MSTTYTVLGFWVLAGGAGSAGVTGIVPPLDSPEEPAVEVEVEEGAAELCVAPEEPLAEDDEEAFLAEASGLKGL
jgi:hypothetical protein